MHSLPGMMLLYLAAPLFTPKVFCMRSNISYNFVQAYVSLPFNSKICYPLDRFLSHLCFIVFAVYFCNTPPNEMVN